MPDVSVGDVLRLKETYGVLRPDPLAGIFLRVLAVAANGEPIVERDGSRLQLDRGSYKVVVRAG